MPRISKGLLSHWASVHCQDVSISWRRSDEAKYKIIILNSVCHLTGSLGESFLSLLKDYFIQHLIIQETSNTYGHRASEANKAVTLFRIHPKSKLYVAPSVMTVMLAMHFIAAGPPNVSFLSE